MNVRSIASLKVSNWLNWLLCCLCCHVYWQPYKMVTRSVSIWKQYTSNKELAHCLVALWACIASALYCTYVSLKTKSCILVEASLHIQMLVIRSIHHTFCLNPATFCSSFSTGTVYFELAHAMTMVLYILNFNRLSASSCFWLSVFSNSK